MTVYVGASYLFLLFFHLFLVVGVSEPYWASARRTWSFLPRVYGCPDWEIFVLAWSLIICLAVPVIASLHHWALLFSLLEVDKFIAFIGLLGRIGSFDWCSRLVLFFQWCSRLILLFSFFTFNWTSRILIRLFRVMLRLSFIKDYFINDRICQLFYRAFPIPNSIFLFFPIL